MNEEEKRQSIYLLIFLFLCQNKYPFVIGYSFQTALQLEDFLSNAGLSMADLIQDGKGKIEKESKHFIVKHFKASFKIGVSRYEEIGPNNNIQSVSFKTDLTNFSVTEMLDLFGRIFENVSITRSEIEEVFERACNDGFLMPAMKYQNEVRYEIADPRLDKFISDFNFLYLLILHKLYPIWYYRRAPYTQELKWLELFRGQQKTKGILSETYKH